MRNWYWELTRGDKTERRNKSNKRKGPKEGGGARQKRKEIGDLHIANHCDLHECYISEKRLLLYYYVFKKIPYIFSFFLSVI